MIVQAINRALSGTHLSSAEMAEVIGQIMDGQATAAQIGARQVSPVERATDRADDRSGHRFAPSDFDPHARASARKFASSALPAVVMIDSG